MIQRIINNNYKTYKGATIAKIIEAGKITFKAYNNTELIHKQIYLNYSSTQAFKAFKNDIDLNYFQFNTIL